MNFTVKNFSLLSTNLVTAVKVLSTLTSQWILSEITVTLTFITIKLMLLLQF